MDSSLISEKVTQAVGILNELDIDAWLTFVRETTEICDPALHFIAGTNVVWQAAFIIARDGTKVAIAGKGDHGNIERLGVYDRVIPYTESIGPDLIAVLMEINPRKIGINYSLDNVSADGLTHGMYLRLLKLLEGTDLAQRFVSAEPVFSRMRGRKTPEELRRIQQAVDTTMELFDALTQHIQLGWTERQIADFMHGKMTERGLTSSWDWEYDPGVNCGPDTQGGHMPPGDVALEKGHVLHLDFGVKQNGYSSDLQRVWYVLRDGEDSAPQEVQRAFETVQEGIRRAAAMLKPGVVCWTVDQQVRDFLRERGYPEYQHALGHQVGIWAHDGGSVLGPRWERYGERPYDKVEAHQVYTLEFGIQTAYGYVSQEEMVEITADGCRFMSQPQSEIWLLRF